MQQLQKITLVFARARARVGQWDCRTLQADQIRPLFSVHVMLCSKQLRFVVRVKCVCQSSGVQRYAVAVKTYN